MSIHRGMRKRSVWSGAELGSAVLLARGLGGNMSSGLVRTMLHCEVASAWLIVEHKGATHVDARNDKLDGQRKEQHGAPDRHEHPAVRRHVLCGAKDHEDNGSEESAGVSAWTEAWLRAQLTR